MGSKKRTKVQPAPGREPRSLISSAPPSAPADHSTRFLAALGLWCAALWLFQFVTLAKFGSVLNVGVKFGSFGKFADYLLDPAAPLRLDAWDGLLALSLLALPAYLVYLHVGFGAMSAAWNRIAAPAWKKILFLFLLFACLNRFALHPGAFPSIVDQRFFLGASAEFRRALEMGEFGNYSTLFYSGWNCRQYVGNLYAMLSGTLEFLTGSHAGIKLLLWVSGAASGVGMFLWIEALTKKSSAAFFAAVAFGLNYWHYYQVFVIGHHPMALVYACLPWPFYFLEAGLADPRLKLRWFLACAAPLAGIVYTHFVWGAMAWGIFTVYALVRLLGRAPGADRRALLGCFAVSLVLEFLILAGLITAPLVQKEESVARYTHGLAVNEMDAAKRIRPEVLYQWYNGHWSVGQDAKAERQVSSDIFNTYLGLVPLLFALFGLRGWSGKTGIDANVLRLIFLMLAASLALTFFYYDLVEIPGLSLFRIFLDQRYQTFAVFFMSAAAAFGVAAWGQWIGNRFAASRRAFSFWAVLPLLLLAADVGSTTFQFPFEPEPLDEGGMTQFYRKESGLYLERGENVPYHFFLEGDKVADYGGVAAGWKAITLGMPSDLGIHSESAPLQSAFGTLFYQALTDRSRFPHVFPDDLATAYFYLNNFRDAVFRMDEGRRIDTSRVRIQGVEGRHAFGNFARHSPLVASTAAVPYAWKDERNAFELEGLYRAMEIDYDRATAARLFVRPEAALPPLAETGTPVLNILEYKVFPKKFFYRIRLDRAAFVRLPASYYSYLSARIDGREAAFYPGATYEVVLQVPSGEHVLEVGGGWDPYRKAWLYITWLSIALLLFLAIRFPAGFWKDAADRRESGFLPS